MKKTFEFSEASVNLAIHRSEDDEQICLVMLDTKTRVGGGWSTPPVRGTEFESNACRNFDRAMTSLVGM
jgi:hypothetical protein